MATVAEKLQLTLNSKNGIKQALEKNNVSTDGKVFSEYGDLVDKAINSGWPEILYTFSSNDSSEHWLSIDLPYDFNIWMDISDYAISHNQAYIKIETAPNTQKYNQYCDKEVHQGSAGASVYYCTFSPTIHLHITRA